MTSKIQFTLLITALLLAPLTVSAKSFPAHHPGFGNIRPVLDSDYYDNGT